MIANLAPHRTAPHRTAPALALAFGNPDARQLLHTLASDTR